MNRVFFITPNDLKEYTTINYAVEDKLLKNSILDAQDIDIQPIIGTRLYNKLQYLITGGTISGIYKEMIDKYISKALIKSSERRVLLWIYAKIRNKGIENQDSDNSQVVDIEVLNKLRHELNNDFEFFSNKLKKYLIDNSGNIPEYKEYNPDNKSEFNKPETGDSYFSGIVL